MSKSLRIVFLGTPEFAVPMLEILHHSRHRVVSVVTAPDKPAGRGMNLSFSEVKKYAVAENLPLLQPMKLKNETFLEALRALHADIFVVVAFRMLPEAVWNMPPLGTINLHASLLPNYRGAAPINWAVINGETETGVSTFRLKQEIDTGEIILRQRVPIRPDETAGELYAELMDTGKKVLLQTIDSIADDNYKLVPQDHITEVKPAPKIFTETCRIDWSKSAAEIYDLVRGLSPYPAAWTNLQGKLLKITRCNKFLSRHNRQPGETESDGSSYLRFYCADGYIEPTELQLEGKKKMNIGDFLRGFKTTG